MRGFNSWMVSSAVFAASGSVASQPVKAGEVPAKVTPKVTFQQAMDVATTKLDALIRGGVECITYISSAFLIGYLSRSDDKQKMNVMRDEFALALGKKGLGGTQSKRYLDYAFKLAGVMFKDCSYGGEVGTLIAATSPEKAHDAVKAYLHRQTNGKKTPHGTKLTDATSKVGMLGIFLGLEDDPNEGEDLANQPTEQTKRQKARKAAAEKVNKDPMILRSVSAEHLENTVATSTVINFVVLVEKHTMKLSTVEQAKRERDEIVAAYDARIKALSQMMGGKRSEKPAKSKRSGHTGKTETVQKAA